MGNSTISMAIFNSYVKLPEGSFDHVGFSENCSIDFPISRRVWTLSSGSTAQLNTEFETSCFATSGPIWSHGIVLFRFRPSRWGWSHFRFQPCFMPIWEDYAVVLLQKIPIDKYLWLVWPPNNICLPTSSGYNDSRRDATTVMGIGLGDLFPNCETVGDWWMIVTYPYEYVWKRGIPQWNSHLVGIMIINHWV